MTINKKRLPRPPKKTAEDLEHPSANTYVAWNGDVRQKRSKTRWNGAPDIEDKGFAARRAERGQTVDRTPVDESVRRTYFNGQLVEEVCTENIPVARPVLGNQPKRMPVAFRETGEVQTPLPPNLRPVVQQPETDG